MKLDKETLLKEHFWFLLALALPLALVSLILLWTTSSGLIAAPQKKIKDAEADLKRIQSSKPKHPRWTDKLKIREEAAVAQQKKVWEKNWHLQEKLMTWPDFSSPQIQAELSRMYFGDDISSTIRSAYPTKYGGQIPDIIQLAQPKNSLGQTMVQARDDNWDALLRIMPTKVDDWKQLPPTSEDLWLAQEDLWVQRGLLQIIRDVNDAAATFTAKGDGKQMVFTNPDWMLELNLADTQGKQILHYRLTNIGNRRQSLGFSFEIIFDGTSSHGFLPIDGEPLAPGKSIPAEGEQAVPGKAKPGEWPIPADVGHPSGLKSVRQIFDWRTVPVKRVDKIVLGALSHRQSALPLKPAKVFASKQQDTAGTTTGTTSATPSPGLGKGLAGAEAAGGKAPGSEDVSLNGLVRNRYISTTDEVRRMPIGMVLIVDQAHMQDVLTAVANSPLRIQITQWLWRRYHGDIKPKEEEQRLTAGENDRNREGRLQRPPVAEARPGLPPFGGRPGVAPGMPPHSYGSGPGMASEEQEWDLIELSIYGVASLYERYPPKPPTSTNATNAATATAPATGTTPASRPTTAPAGAVPASRPTERPGRDLPRK